MLGVSALEDIQGALNAVRSAAAEADWQTRLDALVLLLAASEDIVRRARQLTAPKQRTRTVTVPRVKTSNAMSPHSHPSRAQPSSPVSPQFALSRRCLPNNQHENRSKTHDFPRRCVRLRAVGAGGERHSEDGVRTRRYWHDEHHSVNLT